MSTPYYGEIRIVSFNFAPKGWALCNGQLMPINQNQALFSILGTSYGGDGRSTFALPDFRGRVPIHASKGFLVGQNGGTEAHTLTQAEMPAHNHVASASLAAGDSQFIATVFPTTSQNIPAAVGGGIYAPPSSLTTLHPSSVESVGGSQGHENRQPFLVVNFIICLAGYFPSRN